MLRESENVFEKVSVACDVKDSVNVTVELRSVDIECDADRETPREAVRVDENVIMTVMEAVEVREREGLRVGCVTVRDEREAVGVQSDTV